MTKCIGCKDKLQHDDVLTCKTCSKHDNKILQEDLRSDELKHSSDLRMEKQQEDARLEQYEI